jgi:hypothetical protein
MVVHKPARECPMAEPHRSSICGIVKARHASQAAADTVSSIQPTKRQRKIKAGSGPG